MPWKNQTRPIAIATMPTASRIQVFISSSLVRRLEIEIGLSVSTMCSVTR